MHWFLWLVFANVSVACTEYIYRKGSYENFLVALPYIFPLMLVSQCGLFYAFRQAPSLFVVGVVFTIVNVAFRLVSVHMLGETMSVLNYVGVGLLVISAVMLRWG